MGSCAADTGDALPEGSGMITDKYRFADTTIQISSSYERVHLLCKAYRTDDEYASLSVQISQDDIHFERAMMGREDQFVNQPARNYPDSYLESLAVYRKIAERMPAFDTFLMHGSCIAVDGEAYLFTAKSGTGKSTHTRLWRQLFGDRALMVNDDKPLIRVTQDGAEAFGTPWDGKHRLSTNISVPLKGVCILERAERNSIRKITAGEAYPMLLQQIYRPLNAAAMTKTLQLIDRMTSTVPLWRLGCNMDPEAAKVASEAMKG